MKSHHAENGRAEGREGSDLAGPREGLRSCYFQRPRQVNNQRPYGFGNCSSSILPFTDQGLADERTSQTTPRTPSDIHRTFSQTFTEYSLHAGMLSHLT